MVRPPLKNPAPKLALAVFARAPIPGRAKTRLIPILGAHGAAALQFAFISDTLRKCSNNSAHAERYLFLDGPAGSIRIPPGWRLERQRGRGLGGRLARAFDLLLRRHEGAIIIGTDSPQLPPRLVSRALGELKASDAVLGPCPDGGFYLIGFRRSQRVHPEHLMALVRWGTSYAFCDVLRNLTGSELIVTILEPVSDIDRPADLKRLQQELRNNGTARRLSPSTWQFLGSIKIARRERS